MSRPPSRNPALFNKLKIRRIDPHIRPLPIGGIIVWERGQCGYSEDHGHIEIVVSQKPPSASSDGCRPVLLDCLDKAADKGGVNVYVPVRSPAPTAAPTAR